jgi:GNAT superfamily N-acetyltransferase
VRPALREATHDDLPALGILYRRSSLVYEDGRDALLAHPEYLEFALPVAGEWCCRVAVSEDGTIVGFATALFPGDWAELEDLFVDPGWMRRGVGSVLVGDIAEVVRRRHLDRIEVTANPNALAFYEKAGFVADGEVEMPLGPGIRMHRPVT